MNFGSFRVQVYIEDFMYQLIAKASSVVVLTSKLVMSSNILTHEKKTRETCVSFKEQWKHNLYLSCL
jgi:hypothetical protein